MAGREGQGQRKERALQGRAGAGQAGKWWDRTEARQRHGRGRGRAGQGQGHDRGKGRNTAEVAQRARVAGQKSRAEEQGRVSYVGQGSARQGRAGQDRTGTGIGQQQGMDRASQGMGRNSAVAGQGRGRAGQDRTGQDRTGQDRTGQDRTGQGRTAIGRDRTRAAAGQDACGAPFLFLLFLFSVAPEKGTLGAHKKTGRHYLSNLHGGCAPASRALASPGQP